MNATDVDVRLIQQLSALDPLDQCSLLLNRGLAVDPEEQWRFDHADKIPGCETNIWAHVEQIDGTIFLQARSDSVLVDGALSMLGELCRASTLDKAASLSPRFIDAIDDSVIDREIKCNGIAKVVQRIRSAAISHSTPGCAIAAS